MEEKAPYANSSQGLYWVGNRLFFYELPIAHITQEPKLTDWFTSRIRWVIQFNLPFDDSIHEDKCYESVDQIKSHIEKHARILIDKIKAYD